MFVAGSCRSSGTSRRLPGAQISSADGQLLEVKPRGGDVAAGIFCLPRRPKGCSCQWKISRRAGPRGHPEELPLRCCEPTKKRQLCAGVCVGRRNLHVKLPGPRLWTTSSEVQAKEMTLTASLLCAEGGRYPVLKQLHPSDGSPSSPSAPSSLREHKAEETHDPSVLASVCPFTLFKGLVNCSLELAFPKDSSIKRGHAACRMHLVGSRRWQHESLPGKFL